MSSPIDKSPVYVFVDLDNTVVDTAIRKERLLTGKFGIRDVTVDAVRSDYRLTSFLGEGSQIAKEFFEYLDTEECVKEFGAPIFEGVVQTLTTIRKRGYEVLFLTARPQRLKGVTIDELKTQGIECDADGLLMPRARPQSSEGLKEFKKNVLVEYLASGSIVAMIGDRPSDILAAQELRIPAILLNSTINKNEKSALFQRQTVGISESSDWYAINNKLLEIEQGGQEMQSMRKMFSDQYASWLKDLDFKLQTVSIIAGAIIAFCGYQVGSGAVKGLEYYLLVLSLFLATFALLYAIRGLTSRSTSGPGASNTITIRAKQWIAILIDHPSSWKRLPNDPIDTNVKLREAPLNEQLTAHTKFFFGQYKTNNPEILQNMRLLELRSANYSKVYPERIASYLLSLSVVSLLISFVCRIFGKDLLTIIDACNRYILNVWQYIF